MTLKQFLLASAAAIDLASTALFPVPVVKFQLRARPACAMMTAC